MNEPNVWGDSYKCFITIIFLDDLVVHWEAGLLNVSLGSKNKLIISHYSPELVNDKNL